MINLYNVTHYIAYAYLFNCLAALIIYIIDWRGKTSRETYQQLLIFSPITAPILAVSGTIVLIIYLCVAPDGDCETWEDKDNHL